MVEQKCNNCPYHPQPHHKLFLLGSSFWFPPPPASPTLSYVFSLEGSWNRKKQRKKKISSKKFVSHTHKNPHYLCWKNSKILMWKHKKRKSNPLTQYDAGSENSCVDRVKPQHSETEAKPWIQASVPTWIILQSPGSQNNFPWSHQPRTDHTQRGLRSCHCGDFHNTFRSRFAAHLDGSPIQQLALYSSSWHSRHAAYWEGVGMT